MFPWRMNGENLKLESDSSRLANCEFYFGAENVPESERQYSGFKLDTGISFITTEDAESLWLLEIIEGPKPD